MSISKRSLIFVFAVVTAISFFAHHGDAVAQNYRGLDMPEEYYLTPAPYDPYAELTKDQQKKVSKEVKNAYKAQSREWSTENRQARSAISAGESKVKEVLASGGDVTSDADARKFLEDYTFPSMTQTDPDTLSSLGTKRVDFLKNYLNERVTGGARNKMIDFSIQKLQANSTDSSLHPSARVNAIVLLSQLTDRPLTRDQAPIASAKAFRALLEIYSGQDPKKNPDYVKVAALSGIKNQLELNSKSGQAVDAAAKTQLVDSAVALMTAPAERDKDAAAYWSKRQAVQLSAVLKDAKTLPALLAILNDEASSHDLKLEVVKTIVKTGAMDTDAKANSDVLVAICKFAESSVANEAVRIQNHVKEMVRNGMLFGDKDFRQTGVQFGPGGETEVDAGFGYGSSDQIKPTVPMVELPNYQLSSSRNRIRAVVLFCQQAIGGSKEAGLRSNLDAEAEGLARGTVSELNSLLRKSEVGLLNREERRPSDAPTIEIEDRDRKTSYADQMTKICEASAGELGKLLSEYTTEPAATDAPAAQ